MSWILFLTPLVAPFLMPGLRSLAVCATLGFSGVIAGIAWVTIYPPPGDKSAGLLVVTIILWGLMLFLSCTVRLGAHLISRGQAESAKIGRPHIYGRR
jgi:hypothetical protein